MHAPHPRSITVPSRPRPSGPTLCRGLLLAGLALALAVSESSSQPCTNPSVTGCWTQPTDDWADWGHTQIHMALLPGDGVNQHSLILSWQSGTSPGLGLHGWNLGAPNCTAYPGSPYFQDLTSTLLDPGVNIFCGGHAGLAADGRLLISGGDDGANFVGLADTRIFDPGSRTWVSPSPPAMTYRRWYPTTTTLPEGRAISFSGTQYRHMAVFGGTEDPTSSSSAPRHELQRFALTQRGQWDPQVTGTGPSLPDPREGHTAVYRDVSSSRVMTTFGGRTTGGAVLDDVWQLTLKQEDTQEVYSWTNLNPDAPIDPPPGRRYRHAAVMRGDGSMVVYGGSADVGHASVSDRVHKLFQTGPTSWRWELLSPTGTAPGARYGHAATYDEQHNRMVIFGGRHQGNALANDKAYTLDFDFNPPRWDEYTPSVPGGGPPPVAREGHSLVVDPGEYTRAFVQWKRMILFGGQALAGKQKDTWVLWIKKTDPAVLEWEQVSDCPSGCLGRTRHAATWDINHNRMVVFGGDTGAGPADAGTWGLKVGSGTSLTWQQPALASYPSTGLAGATAIPSTVLYARQPEVFTPGSPGSWNSTLVQPKTQPLYPFMFVLPSGNLFHAGTVLTHLLNRGEQPWAWVRSPSACFNDPFPPCFPYEANTPFAGGSAVMFRPGEIMKCGYGSGDVVRDSTAVIVFDAADGTTGWTVTAEMQMQQGRHNHNLTLLPNGKVLATGGTYKAGYASTVYVTGPELWNPATRTWSDYGTLAADPAVRGYHSCALLLPDSRILSAGGSNEPNEPNVQTKVTIYCPPYLFDAQGNPAPRPQITSAPATVTYGESFVIGKQITDQIASACLIRPAAVTHAFDQNQRYVPLDFEVLPDNTGLRAVAPTGGGTAPPGDYMLFIVNQSGVPAVAKWVRLGNCASVPCDTKSPPRTIDLNPDIVGPNEVWLVWSAPGDDASPLAGEYDLRYSGTPISTENAYAAASLVPAPPNGPPDDANEPPVATFGTPMSYTKFDLAACTQYSFALKTRDGTNNWSLRSNTVTLTTTCGGGGGGYSAHRVDGDREGGGLPATAVPPPSGEATGDDAAPVAGSGSSSAELTGVSSLNPGTGVLEAETRRTPGGGWQVTLRLIAQAVGVDPADAGAIVSQVRDDAGGWRTLGRFRPTPGQSPLGLGALRDQGRVVFPAGYGLDRVVTDLRSGGQDYALALADHSRLGPLGEPFLASGGSVEMTLGDGLTITYDPTGTALPGAAGWYLLVRSGGVAGSSPTPARRELTAALPSRFALQPNQPNPFRRTTAIAFDLPVASPVTLEVFDLLGRKVTTLAEGAYPAGTHTVEWDLREGGGTPIRPGVYVCRLVAGVFQAREKMTVLP